MRMIRSDSFRWSAFVLYSEAFVPVFPMQNTRVVDLHLYELTGQAFCVFLYGVLDRP